MGMTSSTPTTSFAVGRIMCSFVDWTSQVNNVDVDTPWIRQCTIQFWRIGGELIVVVVIIEFIAP